jgi:hypothetical protein
MSQEPSSETLKSSKVGHWVEGGGGVRGGVAGLGATESSILLTEH